MKISVYNVGRIVLLLSNNNSVMRSIAITFFICWLCSLSRLMMETSEIIFYSMSLKTDFTPKIPQLFRKLNLIFFVVVIVL